jgi:cytochrome c556
MQMHTATDAELSKLVAVAKGGDLNAIKPQFGAAGASCKACHDAYRNK